MPPPPSKTLVHTVTCMHIIYLTISRFSVLNYPCMQVFVKSSYIQIWRTYKIGDIILCACSGYRCFPNGPGDEAIQWNLR